MSYVWDQGQSLGCQGYSYHTLCGAGGGRRLVGVTGALPVFYTLGVISRFYSVSMVLGYIPRHPSKLPKQSLTVRALDAASPAFDLGDLSRPVKPVLQFRGNIIINASHHYH